MGANPHPLLPDSSLHSLVSLKTHPVRRLPTLAATPTVTKENLLGDRVPGADAIEASERSGASRQGELAGYSM
jgi:hypothetical protein